MWPRYCVKEDLADRGQLEVTVLNGVVLVARGQMARLFEEFDQVWRW
jgi:hypothetical protein